MTVFSNYKLKSKLSVATHLETLDFQLSRVWEL